jgi:glycosyltransferase involved in cell wall biosynthesis
MRLLFVALRSPFTSQSGNTLILRNHLDALHVRHQIDLAALGTDADAEHADLRRWCERVVMVPPPSPAVRRLAQASGLLTGRPLRVSAYSSQDLRAVIARLVIERSYDAVVVQLCEAAQFLPLPATLPAIMDFEDPPSIKLRRTIPWLAPRPRRAARLDLPLMRRYEARVARAFDRLVFVSADDAREFGEEHGCPDKVACVRHAVETGVAAGHAAARVEHSIAITGNMSHPPNVAGVRFIVREVFPRVRQAIPGAQLWLVGANPAPEVRDLARVDGITVTGQVPDVGVYLTRARVALCAVPVVLGTQTKVLEAMANGTPVVTTTAGNRGIDGVDGVDLYVADSPELFTDRIVSLLRGTRWSAMSDAGRTLARDSFSPAQAAADLERVIAETIAGRRRHV